MHKWIGALFVSILLFEGQAFPQSIIPSKVQPINPTVTEYFHIFSCYDSFTGNLLDCQVKDGLNPPGNDSGSKGGHTHGGTFPLTES